MTYHGNQTDFQQMKNEVAALKTHLRRHQISMGDAKVLFPSFLIILFDHLSWRLIISSLGSIHYRLSR